MPALITSQLMPALEMKEFKATGTVIFSSDMSNMTAKKSSFQMFMKAKQKIAAIPGLVIGNTTLNSDWNMLHPSILAASSRLTGIRSKKPLLIIVQNAMTVDTYTTIKAALLSTNPSLEKIVNKGTMRIKVGMVWVKYRASCSAPFIPLRLIRERANPLSTEIIMASNEATREITKEFLKYREKLEKEKSFA